MKAKRARLAGKGLALVLALAPAWGVSRLQPRLAAEVHAVKERDDVSALPPPRELPLLTLGYDAAAVDLLWAKLLVEYGTHWHEKRALDVVPYFDAILALEPAYAPLYRFADTLLVFKPPRGEAEDARTARRYLERGTRERPYDHAVWQELGQFIAFLGPGFLPDASERERWRRDGAVAMARAVELGADAERTLAAATLLDKTGERQAAITYLRRAYALTDDEETRRELAFKLDRLEATDVREATERRVRWIEGLWRQQRYLTRGEFLLLGPPRDVAHCAGIGGDPRGPGERACGWTWDDALRAAGE